ncbi:MAG: response regulator transcription factor [Candidatus Eremiobacteraeota bacterium]|nr:response regulator transcription factor [Candidatus Eremiobacteraeota bacterium]MBC5802534.1 response regulator transcription factor [Candidatus Eremiobacteraeota bacterium]MBC5822754.1 response regulator transcription factor [Candidatus Eremiobacteraeota bacterium]
MIRTVVCAGPEGVRAGLAALVRREPQLALVGEATPADLRRMVNALAPDVVIERRDRDHGAAALRVPSVSLVSDPRAAWESERLDTVRGPHAILADDANADAIVAAIAAVAAGLNAFPAHLSATRAPVTPDDERTSVPERLTLRETDVLAELARGVPNKAIAARLAISEHTVKFHIASIFTKLGVASRTEAVAQGIRLGLVMV